MEKEAPDYASQQTPRGLPTALAAAPTPQCRSGPSRREESSALRTACGAGTGGPTRATPSESNTRSLVGSWPRMEALQGGVPQAEVVGAAWGPEERPRMAPRPLAEERAGKCSAQERDLRGGTAGGRPTPPGAGPQGCGLSGSSSAGACPLAWEPCGAPSSRNLSQEFHPRERASRCSAATGASSQSSCLATLGRDSAGAQHPTCHPCGDRANSRGCPRARHCRGCTGDRPRHLGVDLSAFPVSLPHPERVPAAPAQRLYACAECGKAFARTSSLLQHERIHTGERPYACPECGRAFVRCSGLHRHQKTHAAARPRRNCLRGRPGPPRRETAAGAKPFACAECAQAFSLFSHLVEHWRVHTGEKPYACPECGKAFNQRSNLSRHRRTHSSARPYACALCEKAFKGRSGLLQHQRAHTGERPYGCPECGKAFRGCSELRQHERLHSGEKPYICRDCGQAFVRNCSLVRHRRVHTGERPYACGQCGRAFSQRSNLNEHQKRHAGHAAR